MVEAKLVASWWRSFIVKCLFVVMEMMVTIHMILGTGTKQSSFRSKITIAAMVLEVFITYLCHRQLAWKKSRKGAVTAQNINCFTWPRKKRVALGRQSFFRTPIFLQSCYLTGFLFGDEMYLCIKTYAFARSSDWVLCIWLTHPKLVVHRKHRKQAWCALLLLLFSLLSTRVHKLRIWVAENTEV